MTTKELGKRIKEARLAKKMTQSEVVGNFITRNMLSQIESGTASPSIRTLEYLSKALDIPMNQLMSDEASRHDNDALIAIANADTANTTVENDNSALGAYINAKKNYMANDFITVIELLENEISTIKPVDISDRKSSDTSEENHIDPFDKKTVNSLAENPADIAVKRTDNLSEENLLYDEMTALLAITCYKQADLSSLSHSYKIAISYAKKAIEYSSKGIFANSELKTKSLMLLEELLNEQLASDNIIL